MKKAIELADTTFRAYKKGNGAVALHLRTHLIVYADANFRAKIWKARPSLDLSEPGKPYGIYAFMKERPRCWLQFPDGKQYKCQVGPSPFPETRSIQRSAGGPWVTMDTEDITDQECVLFFFLGYVSFDCGDIFGEWNHRGLSIANMKMVFHIDFPGRPPGKIIIQRKVPILRRGQGW